MTTIKKKTQRNITRKDINKMILDKLSNMIMAIFIFIIVTIFLIFAWRDFPFNQEFTTFFESLGLFISFLFLTVVSVFDLYLIYILIKGEF